MGQANHAIDVALGGSELPLKLRRLAGRKCTRCGEPAAEDSEECAACDDDSRARKRKSASKKRRERRAAKKCRDCGKRSKTLRCKRCAKKKRKKARGVDNAARGVDIAAADPHFRIEHDKRPERAGQSTVRYVGKSHRGRLSREEQIVEDQRDAQFAIDYLKEFVRALEVLKRGDVLALPAVQRDAAKREAAQFPSSASRICDDLVERYGGG